MSKITTLEHEMIDHILRVAAAVEVAEEGTTGITVRADSSTEVRIGAEFSRYLQSAVTCSQKFVIFGEHTSHHLRCLHK